jgi:hypothetical protein
MSDYSAPRKYRLTWFRDYKSIKEAEGSFAKLHRLMRAFGYDVIYSFPPPPAAK